VLYYKQNKNTNFCNLVYHGYCALYNTELSLCACIINNICTFNVQCKHTFVIVYLMYKYIFFTFFSSTNTM
jgi:hypothetical protein